MIYMLYNLAFCKSGLNISKHSVFIWLFEEVFVFSNNSHHICSVELLNITWYLKGKRRQIMLVLHTTGYDIARPYLMYIPLTMT